jgi:hypothetical protein
VHKIEIAAKHARNRVNAVYEKLEIFKEAQNGKVNNNTKPENMLFPLLIFCLINKFAYIKIRNGGKQKKRTKCPVPVTVKHIACEDKKVLFEPLRKRIMNGKNYNKEYKKDI